MSAPAYLSVDYFRLLIDPRITSVNIDSHASASDGERLNVQVYWHEDYDGGVTCRASLSGEGNTIEEAINALHGSSVASDRDQSKSLKERFEESASAYAEHRYVRFDLDPGEQEQVAVVERAFEEKNLAQLNEHQRHRDDLIFSFLKKKGYDFRFTSCAAFHRELRRNRAIYAVEVIEAEQGRQLEEKWAKSRSERENNCNARGEA